MSIKAHYRREERYEGLQLVFGSNDQAKEKILLAIEAVKKRNKAVANGMRKLRSNR